MRAPIAKKVPLLSKRKLLPPESSSFVPNMTVSIPSTASSAPGNAQKRWTAYMPALFHPEVSRLLMIQPNNTDHHSARRSSTPGQSSICYSPKADFQRKNVSHRLMESVSTSPLCFRCPP